MNAEIFEYYQISGVGFVIVAFFGLVLGSFATALTYRVPRGISWAFGTKKEGMEAHRSACPQCKTPLQVFDLIPVFSWALQKGLCRYCKEPIPLRYPLIELSVVLACLGIYIFLGATVEALFLLATVPFLAALTAIDLEYKILPNQLVFIVGGIGLGRLAFMALNTLSWDVVFSVYVAGAFIFAGLSWFLGWFLTKILKKDSLGFGDVKFFAVAGVWLGLPLLPLFFILAGSFGVVLAVLWQVLKKEAVFPFGPALILSFYILLLMDGSLLS